MKHGTHNCKKQEPLGDEDAWNDALRVGMVDHPELAQEFAFLLSVIKESVESRTGEMSRVADTLDRAIHLMFPFTETYRAAQELWMLSLRGVLEWKNEPGELLRPAIEQGNKELRRLLAGKGWNQK